MTKEYEKKMRYFVIGEDNPICECRVEPCGHFGISETPVINERKAHTVKIAETNVKKDVNMPNAEKHNPVINFGTISDKMKALGIEIKVNV